MADPVVLVDEDGAAIGMAPKLEAHRLGLLHRAVSVVLFDGRGSVLLQQRARGKYHSGGLWSNTCCGHPRRGERPIAAASRRLEEEMGIVVPLARAFTFQYRAPVNRALIEHEVDQVFLGYFRGVPRPDPREVAAWEWAPFVSVEAGVVRRPERYTAWLPHLLRAMRANAREARIALAQARRHLSLRSASGRAHAG